MAGKPSPSTDLIRAPAGAGEDGPGENHRQSNPRNLPTF